MMKGEELNNTATVAGWIKRIADDERQRDAVRARETETATRKADLVRVHGRRLVDDLRAAVARDVQAFRNEFAGERARDIVCEDIEGDGGFAVRKQQSPTVFLTVVPRLQASVVGCDFRFLQPNGLPPREIHVDLIFAGDGSETLKLKHDGTGQVFTSANALSEYLLVPVFTGRPVNDGPGPRFPRPSVAAY